MRLKNVEDVAAWRLCAGCGACAYACEENKIRLVNVEKDGIRPVIEGDCGSCKDCLDFCPGIGVSHKLVNEAPGAIPALKKGWGQVLEIWEGYAADPELRFRSSSGGLASAIAIFCVERMSMHGVLHIGAKETKPWENRTVLSRSRDEVVSRTGSRYSPASPCDRLGEIENAPSPCVFIGKPCDVEALRKAEGKRQGLKRNVGLAIGIFCAGTPSTLGTLKLLSDHKVGFKGLSEIRYRGMGWPGKCAALNTGGAPAMEIPYSEAWGFLQKFRPFRCHLCPDGTSEFADLSCGDPWYRDIKEGEQGYSLVLVRTELGRKILRAAHDAGYIFLKRAGPSALKDSQDNLLQKRQAIWGRLLAMKMLFLPVPVFDGFSLYENWKEQKAKEKLRSILGTVKRALARGYSRKFKYRELTKERGLHED